VPKASKPTLRALGSRIRTLREAKGWSQEELADRAAVDRSYMSGIERGVRNPSALKLADLARALGVPTASLFTKD
jgi:transcriptional regulator with XRE-family HTH domain